MATLKEWMKGLNVAGAAISQNGNGVNFFSEKNVLLGTWMTREETPSNEDLFAFLKSKSNWGCTQRGNFLTLTEPTEVVNVSSLYEEEEAPKGKIKVKA